LAKTERLESAKELIYNACYEKILNSTYHEVFSKHWNLPIQKEDIGIQIYNGIQKAIYSYDYTSPKSMSFYNWAKRVCYGECMNLLRTLTSNKFGINNNMYSYDVFDQRIIDSISQTKNEDLYDHKTEIDYDDKLVKLKQVLNDEQIIVLEHKLGGKKNNEIARILSCNTKKISNIYEKIKKIAKKDL
jgi:RNA polymerase sigma factor (sigma-70 family)